MQKKGKERAYVIGRAGGKDISWPSSPIGVVSCTASVLCHRTGRREGHQLAVVAYRSCWLYWSPIGWSARAKKVAERKEEGRGRRKRRSVRGKSYNLHTDGGELY